MDSRMARWNILKFSVILKATNVTRNHFSLGGIRWLTVAKRCSTCTGRNTWRDFFTWRWCRQTHAVIGVVAATCGQQLVCPYPKAKSGVQNKENLNVTSLCNILGDCYLIKVETYGSQEGGSRALWSRARSPHAGGPRWSMYYMVGH